MYCFKCGKKIRDDSVFCAYCGVKQSEDDCAGQEAMDNAPCPQEEEKIFFAPQPEAKNSDSGFFDRKTSEDGAVLKRRCAFLREGLWPVDGRLSIYKDKLVFSELAPFGQENHEIAMQEIKSAFLKRVLKNDVAVAVSVKNGNIKEYSLGLFSDSIVSFDAECIINLIHKYAGADI